MSVRHTSAKASHYDNESTHYDLYNEENSKATNSLITKTLKQFKAKTVLDLACGTGSQVFWLEKGGFNVTGVDINSKMLSIARKKAKRAQHYCRFVKGDMRTSKMGQYDAVIAIFNAIGHLTKKDFSKAIKNAAENLNDQGIYIFDIFNLDYLLHKDNITKLTIDWQKKSGDKIVRELQYSTISREGNLASTTLNVEQTGRGKPNVKRSSQSLQVYSMSELKVLLSQNGFKVVSMCDAEGKKVHKTKSERLFVVATLKKNK